LFAYINDMATMNSVFIANNVVFFAPFCVG